MVDSTSLYGSGDTFSVSDDGGIIIEEDGVYMIAASIYIKVRELLDSRTEATIRKSVHIINQNNVELSTGSDNLYVTNGYEAWCDGAISVSPKIINLSAGDILYLYGRCVDASALIYPKSPSSFLTIMRVG